MITCPVCKADLAAFGSLRFCSFCGTKVPLTLILDERVNEEEVSEKLRERGFNLQINSTEDPCNDEEHLLVAQASKIITFGPKTKFCHKCGKQLPEV